MIPVESLPTANFAVDFNLMVSGGATIRWRWVVGIVVWTPFAVSNVCSETAFSTFFFPLYLVPLSANASVTVCQSGDKLRRGRDLAIHTHTVVPPPPQGGKSLEKGAARRSSFPVYQGKHKGTWMLPSSWSYLNYIFHCETQIRRRMGWEWVMAH